VTLTWTVDSNDDDDDDREFCSDYERDGLFVTNKRKSDNDEFDMY